MSEPMTQQEFTRRVQQSRAEFDRAVAARGIAPSSLKDILGHIAWYEREMIHILRTRVFSGSSLWDLPLHQRNAEIAAQLEDLSLPDALGQSTSVYTELIGLLETLTDEDLNDPGHFSGMPSDWLPWQVIASNTYEHYDAHLGDLSQPPPDR